MKTVISSILIMGGIVLMAGSAGDCDGKCMDQANTLGQMITYAMAGLSMFLVGAYVLIKE